MKLARFVFLCLFALFVLQPRSSIGAEPTRIRVGYPSPSASFSPLFVAKEAGLFEKYGLSAELLYRQGVQITQVHVAKQIDFTVTGSPLPLQASVEGADLVLIASSIDKFIYKLLNRVYEPRNLRA
jgi:ABC-type nitrate/sulfonate/bicarbonate transport system substrate-binding protein